MVCGCDGYGERDMAFLQHVCFRMTLGTGDMEDNNGKVAVVTGAAGGI